MRRQRVFEAAIGFVTVFLLVAQIAVWAQRSPKIRTLTEQEMVDMMQGSSIQASRSANTAPTIAQTAIMMTGACRP